jgi:hypothetical protein
MNHVANRYVGKKDWPIRLLQFEDSKHFQTLQVADLILGALAFRLNGFDKFEGASKAKIELATHFLKKARIEVNRVALTPRRLLPIFSRKQKCSDSAGSSQKCQ